MARKAGVLLLAAALAAGPALACAQVAGQAAGPPLVAHAERNLPLPFSTQGVGISPSLAGGLEGVAAVLLVGLISDAIHRSRGRRLVVQHGLENPSDAMAAELAAYLAHDRGAALASRAILPPPGEASPLAGNAENARFVIDVSSSGSFGQRGVGFQSRAQVHDAATGKVAWSQDCNATRAPPPGAAGGQGAIADESLIRVGLRAGVDYCLSQFKDGLVTLDTRDRAAPLRSTAQRTPPARRPAVPASPAVSGGFIDFGSIKVARAPTLGQRNDIVRRLAPLPPGGVSAQVRCVLLLDDGQWRPDCTVASPAQVSPDLAWAFRQLALAYRLEPPAGVREDARYETSINLALYPQDRLGPPPRSGPLLASRAVTLAVVPTLGDLGRNYPAWAAATRTSMRVDATCVVAADLSLACFEAQAARALPGVDPARLREFEAAGLAAASSVSVAPRRFDGAPAAGTWFVLPVAFEAN